MNKQINVSDHLKKLAAIAQWFDEQENVDVEAGLIKVKEAAVLIKESKLRLKGIENEFAEIKKDIDADDEETETIHIHEEIIIEQDPSEENTF